LDPRRRLAATAAADTGFFAPGSASFRLMHDLRPGWPGPSLPIAPALLPMVACFLRSVENMDGQARENVLDGEIAVFDDRGVTRIDDLQDGHRRATAGLKPE
jgi:hypothetical protein